MMCRAGACPRRRKAVGCAVSPAQRARTPPDLACEGGRARRLLAVTGEISAQWIVPPRGIATSLALLAMTVLSGGVVMIDKIVGVNYNG